MSTNSEGSSSYSCKCGVPSPVKVSWTTKNPGRRFVGCTNYKTLPCDSFEWIDPPLSPGSRIAQYYRENCELKSEIEVLKKRVDELTVGITNAKKDKALLEETNLELWAKVDKINLYNKKVKKFVYWVFVIPFMLLFLLFVVNL